MKLCVVEGKEEQRRAELLGKEQLFANVQKDKVSAQRVLQSQAEDILCMRHQRMAVGGRQGGVTKHRCVPWRTAFFVLCFVSGLWK